LATILGEFLYWLTTRFVPGLQPSSSLYDLLFSPISAIILILFLPLFIPLSLAVAILRYRLYDINVLINRALVDGSLTLALVAVYFACVLPFHTLLQAVIQHNSPPAVALSTLIIAALFQPLRRRVQAVIDRRFYQSKYDAARAIEEFGNPLRMEMDLRE